MADQQCPKGVTRRDFIVASVGVVAGGVIASSIASSMKAPHAPAGKVPPPQDAATLPALQGTDARYAFGVARRLYENHMHPRVLLGPDDVARIRLEVRTGLGKDILAAMQSRTAPVRDRVLAAGNMSDEIAKPNAKPGDLGRDALGSVNDLAVVGVIGDDAKSLDAAMRVLAAVPRASQVMQRAGIIGSGLLAYDLIYDRMAPADRAAIAGCAMEQFGRVVLEQLGPKYFGGAGSNMAMTHMLAGFHGVLTIDGDEGVPDLTEQKRTYVDMLTAALYSGLGPEGYPCEDIGYGTQMAGRLGHAVEAAHRAGLYDAYRDCPRFARFGRAMLHFVQPWGENLSNTGDHGDDFDGRTFILARLAARTSDPSLIWLLQTLYYPSSFSKGARRAQNELPLGEGFQVPITPYALLALDVLGNRVHPSAAAKPIPTAFRDAGRGIVTFRSGWDADATFVVFDGSQRPAAAQGHAHDSCGHFSLSALGEYFAIDTGRYNIEQNCHNVILIDGRSGRSTDGKWTMSNYQGVLTDYRPGAFCDSAAADSSHQHNCFWARRRVGLVKGPGMPAYLWTDEDVNKAADAWGEFWWQLHTSPENTIELKDTWATITGWRKGNHLDVHFVLPSPRSYSRPHVLTLEQDVAVNSSYKYEGNAAQRAAAFARPSDMLHHCVWQRPRLLAKVGGLNGGFIALCLPRAKGQAPAAVERLAARDGTFAVKIATDAVEDTLIFAHEHNMLDAGDVSARGQWCVVRRSRTTGDVLAWELADGARLTVAGKQIV